MSGNYPVYVFFTYMNRSGSTMLSQQLSRSDKICVCTEADVLVNMFLEDPNGIFIREEKLPQLQRYWKTDLKLAQWRAGLAEIELPENSGLKTNLDAFLYILKAYRDAVKPGADHVVFKDERLIHLLEKIIASGIEKYDIRCFSLLRDVRGIYESQKRTQMLPSNRYMSRNPVKTAFDWNRFVQKSLTLESRINLILVQYESFVQLFPATFYLLASGLEIDLNSGMNEKGDLEERLLPVMRTIHPDMAKVPDRTKLFAWRSGLRHHEIYILQCISGRWMMRLGYSSESSRPADLLVWPLILLLVTLRLFRSLIKKFVFYFRKLLSRKVFFNIWKVFYSDQ